MTRKAAQTMLLQALEPRRMLSAGDLDFSFSGDGKQLIDLPGSSNELANAVAVDADGKIVLAGKFTGATESDFAVVCLNASGSIDTSFGGGDGIVTIDFAINDEALDLAIDSSGRIVVVGTSSSGAGSNARDFAVARLTPAGVLDTTFSGDGKLTIDFGTNDDAQAVAIHGTAIYVGGYKDIGTTGQFALAKLTNAGALDTAYSGDGKVNFGFGGNNDSRCYDIAVDSAGRVVMVGYDENLGAAGSRRNLAVARLGTNALLDPSFSSDGLLAVDVNFNDELRAVGIDFKGRIVAGGFVDGVVGGADYAAIRVLDNGALDTSFNGDGKFTLDLGNTDKCEDLVLQLDGTITLSGNTLGSGFQAAVVQLQPFTGLLSTSFGDGGDGIQLVDFGTLDQGFAIAHTSDFRTVIAGTDGSGKIAVGRLRDLVDGNFNSPLVSSITPYTRLVPLPDGKLLSLGGDVVRRLLPNGTADPTFTTFSTGLSTITYAPDIAVDGLGRIIVGGERLVGGNKVGVIMRRTANGAVDNAFGGGDGEMTFSFSSGDDTRVNAIAIDASNRIVAAGYNEGAARRVAVARVTTAGALDASFDGDGVNVVVINAGGSLGFDVALQPSNGKIVVVGSEFPGSDAFVLRLNTNGSKDDTFAGNGVRAISFGGINTAASAKSVAFDAGERVLVGGSVQLDLASADTNFNGFVVRLGTNGSFDTSFSGDGMLLLKFSPHGEQIRDIGLDSAGNIVAAGQVQLEPSNSDNRVLVRKLVPSGASGEFDFSGDGAWVAPLQGNTAGRSLSYVPVIANGAVYVGGGERLLRLNVDPAVVDFDFQFETAPQKLRVQFNDNIGATLTASGLAITNTTTNTGLPTSQYSIASYDALTNTAIVNFNSILADGDYSVRFSAALIQNSQGFTLSGDRTRDFFFLQGDANRDRRVNLADFNILANNFGRTNRVFSQADFNYDTLVNLADFNILAARFGTELPAVPNGGGSFNSSHADERPTLIGEIEDLV